MGTVAMALQSFDGAVGRIGDITCPIVSIETLLDTKEAYAQHTGISLRPHDQADIAWLRSLAQR
jgi:hypothetical protein